jgi:hypothetical protein
LVLLEAVGHCPMIEAVDQFVELLADFVRDPIYGRPAGEGPADNSVHPRRKGWRKSKSPASNIPLPLVNPVDTCRQSTEVRAEEA